ncbi:MAG TPA: PAS domain-containing sensor histidine kinase, partial [Geobacteraceae bacterium]
EGMRLMELLWPECRAQLFGTEAPAGEGEEAAPPVKRKLRRLDGSAFFAEVTDGSYLCGDKRKFFALIRNIDRREHAEEALHNSEIRYRELVESANSIILRFDASFRITFLNKFARDFFGCANRNVIGKSVMDIMAPSADASGRYVKSIIEDIFRNPQKYGSHENEVVRGDGSRAWIAWTNKLVYDESGRFREVLSIGNDITERKKAEDALIASREQLKLVGAELSIAEERERQRIAREFHDVIGQDLAVAKIKLDTLLMNESAPQLTPCIREIRELVSETVRELRSQVFQISPPVLHIVGFEAAVESLCEKYQEDCGINVTFADDGMPKPLGKDVRGTLYTMVRELLLNVAKHAKAANVLVSLERMEDTLEIRVEDDGCGFDPANICRPGDKRSCLGLFSIRQRIEYLGGSLAMDSARGRGSRMTLAVPLTGVRQES